MKILEQQIKALKFDYVNSDITSANFPPQEVGTKFKLYYPSKEVTATEVKDYATEHGLQVANIYELLKYAGDGWNDQDWVIALGSSAEVGGDRRVPALYRRGAGRDLCLGWFGGDGWGGRCRFLLRKKPLDAGKLGPSELGTLEARVLELENFRERVEHAFNKAMPSL